MYFLKKVIVLLLQLESRLILKKYRPFIVSVTGSVGKTSTKDAIYDVLKSPALCRADGGICYVRKSEKSLNSDIGLPLTIIGVATAWRSVDGWMKNISEGLRLIFRKNEYPDCLVLEVGADHPGDIKSVAKWLKPDIAIITRVSRTPVHVEFFSSPEEVFEEKASLAHGVRKGGKLVLFADDDKVAAIGSGEAAHYSEIITFGLSETATVRGSHYTIMYVNENGARRMTGFVFKIGEKGSPENFEMKVPGIVGKSYMYPLLAAASVGKARGMDWKDIVKGLNDYHAPKGRMNVIEGMNGSMLIDDTYNSSPDAAMAALETLAQIDCAGSKIAILGDMMELGKYSADEHRNIGVEAARVAKRLITIGQRSRATAEEALRKGMPLDMVKMCDSATDAIPFLASIVHPGDVILVKGSQSVRMERIVSALMKEPARAADLLVRQEKEWLDKK